jgi:hypothetical protein
VFRVEPTRWSVPPGPPRAASTPLVAPRSRPHLRRCLQAPTGGHGYHRNRLGTGKSVAESVRRTPDRLNPTRVSRSRCRRTKRISDVCSGPIAGTIIGVERTSGSRKTRQITDRSLKHPPGRSSRSLKSVVSITAMNGAQRKRPAHFFLHVGAPSATPTRARPVSSSMQTHRRWRRSRDVMMQTLSTPPTESFSRRTRPG